MVEKKSPGGRRKPRYKRILIYPRSKLLRRRDAKTGVYVILNFKKEFGVERKDEHAYVEDDPDEEDMKDVKLDD